MRRWRSATPYIEAFNTGDANAVLDLLTPEVTLSEKYTGMSDSFDAIDRAFFEQHLAWSTAQGTTFTSPECAVTEDGAGAEVTVSCEFGWLYAAEKAVDAPPVPTVLTMVVTPDGISQAAFEYVPEFGVGSFDRWVGDNHSDNGEFVGFGDWNSVAEAEQSGILRAQYVAEWVAFLEANDCTYQGVCRPPDQ
jgi:ketosteroid isomerase-like protein